eukprot:scaffold26143_cov76-Skeletonema_marinoi.AAC.1
MEWLRVQHARPATLHPFFSLCRCDCRTEFLTRYESPKLTKLTTTHHLERARSATKGSGRHDGGKGQLSKVACYNNAVD